MNQQARVIASIAAAAAAPSSTALQPHDVQKFEFKKPSLATIHTRFMNLTGGNWSEENVEQSLIQQAVQPGDTVFELGTNIGRATIVAAACAGPHGRVVTSDLDPTQLEIAKVNAGGTINAASLDNIEFLSVISDEPVYLSDEDAINEGLGAVADDAEKIEDNMVPTTPLDTVRPLRPDVVIVDCEGCFDALLPQLGATFLNQTQAIILENDARDATQQVATQETLRALGFHKTVCVAHPAPDSDPEMNIVDELQLDCFWSVLQRTTGPAPKVKMVARCPMESYDGFVVRAENAVAGRVLPRQ